MTFNTTGRTDRLFPSPAMTEAFDVVSVTGITELLLHQEAYPLGRNDGVSTRVVARPMAPPLEEGRKLGPFRLLRRVGRGAQGDVWLASHDDWLHGPLAVKVLNPFLARNPLRRSQFRHEAERGARLSVQSVLSVVDHGQIEDYHYMAMPFVEGATLRQVIQGRKARRAGEPAGLDHWLIELSERDYVDAMVRAMARATQGLAQLHANHVAHRDIKPANILLDRRSQDGIYLCDLGLGRDLDIATIEQMRDGAGTPIYMAPERLLKVQNDEMRCDIYSMGATLFEAFTLARPVEIPGGLPADCFCDLLLRCRPRTPRQVMAELPIELDAIIRKAMARHPGDRHESASELVADLLRFAVRSGFQPRKDSGGEDWCPSWNDKSHRSDCLFVPLTRDNQPTSLGRRLAH